MVVDHYSEGKTLTFKESISIRERTNIKKGGIKWGHKRRSIGQHKAKPTGRQHLVVWEKLPLQTNK